jgi:MFS family permease
MSEKSHTESAAGSSEIPPGQYHNTATPATDVLAQSTPYEKPQYRYYVLGVLTLVYAFNFIDRQLLVILQEPVKAELGLSDTQLGLLTGFAFAVFYVVCGIPIARWADKGVRRSIIALALTVWSLMTAISGLAQNYLQLMLARMGVGVGEAGGSPPAHSMISDIFDRKHRATALSVYSVGITSASSPVTCWAAGSPNSLAGGWLSLWWGCLA